MGFVIEPLGVLVLLAVETTVGGIGATCGQVLTQVFGVFWSLKGPNVDTDRTAL